MSQSMPEPWIWRHPQADQLQRRSRIALIVVTVLVLAAMGAAAASEVGSGDVVGLLLSVTVGPGLLALVGFGAWYAMFRKPTTFRLAVTPDGVLHQTGSGTRAVPLVGAQAVDARVSSNTAVNSRGTTVRTTVAVLQIVDSHGRQHTIALPGAGLGSRLLTPAELEQMTEQLRWFAGLPTRWG